MPQEEVVVTPAVETPVTPATDKTNTQPADKGAPNPALVAGKAKDEFSERERGLLNETKKEREQRQKLEKQVQELQSNFDRERKRIKLMLADEPQSEEEQETAAIRAQFAKVFPHLAKLTDEQVQKILTATEETGNAREVIDHTWQQHARRMVDSVVEGISEEAGDLSPRQRQKVVSLFISTIESNPELGERYKKGDPTLIKEFVAEYVEDFVTPAKRSATNAEVNRFRPVPRGGDRNVRNTPPAAKIDFSNEKAVEDAMVASYKSHGGSFKR